MIVALMRLCFCVSGALRMEFMSQHDLFIDPRSTRF